MKTPKEIAHLAQMACVLEVCADKPGNVTSHHSFSDTSMLDFLRSAFTVGSAFERAANLKIGEVVLQAIEDTRQFVNTNTNLGIVLLLAPLVKACQTSADSGAIRGNLRAILQDLSVEDAKLTYSAIRLAKGAGLGKVSEADISEEPSITLRQAMALARGRDSIASEYLTDFAITFEISLPALKEAISGGADLPEAILQAYLVILSRIPDTLIARKKGVAAAREVSLKAEEVLSLGGIFTAEGRVAIDEMDRNLRDPAHALNPGTTADLTTAATFLALMEFED